MYLHLGNGQVIPLRDLVVIVDARAMEKADTREFVEVARNEGRIIAAEGTESVRSLVAGTRRLYLSPISVSSLARRASLNPDRVDDARSEAASEKLLPV
ncbi:MAG: DUF370 domain-containing protein [Chloroflexi bacterium]|nr:DUF370 domain-containing protein [Chloroflexota bacterium]